MRVKKCELGSGLTFYSMELPLGLCKLHELLWQRLLHVPWPWRRRPQRGGGWQEQRARWAASLPDTFQHCCCSPHLVNTVAKTHWGSRVLAEFLLASGGQDGWWLLVEAWLHQGKGRWTMGAVRALSSWMTWCQPGQILWVNCAGVCVNKCSIALK